MNQDYFKESREAAITALNLGEYVDIVLLLNSQNVSIISGLIDDGHVAFKKSVTLGYAYILAAKKVIPIDFMVHPTLPHHQEITGLITRSIFALRSLDLRVRVVGHVTDLAACYNKVELLQNKNWIIDKDHLMVKVLRDFQSVSFVNRDSGVQIWDPKIFVKMLGIQSFDTFKEAHYKLAISYLQDFHGLKKITPSAFGQQKELACLMKITLCLLNKFMELSDMPMQNHSRESSHLVRLRDALSEFRSDGGGNARLGISYLAQSIDSFLEILSTTGLTLRYNDIATLFYHEAISFECLTFGAKSRSLSNSSPLSTFLRLTGKLFSGTANLFRNGVTSETFVDLQVVMPLDPAEIVKRIEIRPIPCTAFELGLRFTPSDLPPTQRERIRSQFIYAAAKAFCIKKNDHRIDLIRKLFNKADDCLQYIYDMSLGVSGIYSEVDIAFSEAIGGAFIELSSEILNFYVRFLEHSQNVKFL